MAQHTVMVSPDGKEIVIAMYAPVFAEVGASNVTVETDYPFDDTGMKGGEGKG